MKFEQLARELTSTVEDSQSVTAATLALKKKIKRDFGDFNPEVDLPEKIITTVLQSYSQPHSRRDERITANAAQMLVNFNSVSNTVNNITINNHPTSIETEEEIPHLESPKEEAKESFDLGAYIISSPIVSFLFAVIVLMAMAYITSQMGRRVIEDLQHVPFGIEFAIAFLCDAVGFMASIKMPKDFTIGKWEKIPVRNIYIGAFLAIHCLAALCWAMIFGETISNNLGRIIVALYVPFAVFAYSHLYFIKSK